MTVEVLVPAPAEIRVSPPLYPCECGHPNCGPSVDEVASRFPGLVPHQEILDRVADEYGLVETCRFFEDHVERSVRKFTDVADSYLPRVAARSILEAVNTWHGCPAELCARAD